MIMSHVASDELIAWQPVPAESNVPAMTLRRRLLKGLVMLGIAVPSNKLLLVTRELHEISSTLRSQRI
ncbi:hypothetical protein DPMN_075690 [Dreissena polymorpha]|uniref:Uncharacterized protein n=1 Tax=Dreissena polymorpha TaxID=45954 RepID=A0A9D4BMW9_DREPO|nr:hypothetical protein DPMN_075690 [Dreissena polymorpha]